MGRRCLKTIT